MRNENKRSFRSLFRNGLGDGVEHRHAEVLRTTLTGRHSGNHFRVVIKHLLRVKTAFATGDALHDDACVLVDQNAHRAPSASATTFCAPSFMPLAIVKLKPELRKISWPFSTLVPSMRTTTGTLNLSSFAAFTTPLASTSQRRIPPKIFTKTAFTLGSLSRMRKAFFTCSSEAPPPTSRKFAGLPPLSLMMSMVAIARPAPLTMQPTGPLSLIYFSLYSEAATSSG